MQKVIIGTLGATGIVGVLVLSGGFLKGTGLSTDLGNLAMTAGVVIGIALGALGVYSVIKKLI